METNIFITGATGCIGHYACEAINVAFPNASLFVMVRNTKRFKQPIQNWDNVTILEGSMDDISKYQNTLKKCDYVVHIATVWGYDLDVNLRINRDRTLEMFDYLDPERIKKIIYFSTASILTKNNALSDAAQINGTPYVQSKLAAYNAIKESSWAKKVITLFPTMVVGGGNNYPYSHISQGLKTIKKPIQWAKWLKLNGAFHFLHAKDIASMIVLSMTGQKMPSDIVMGNKVMSFNTAVIEIARHFNQKVWFQIPIPQWLISIIIFILGKRVDKWGAYCAKNPYFEYNVHSPEDFGHNVIFPTFKSVLSEIKNS